MDRLDRWLLNTFPVALLGVLIVGSAVALAVGGLFVVRRRVPAEQRIGNNEVADPLLALLAAIYGIALGFVIVTLFQDVRSADQAVKNEATALEQLTHAVSAFPPAARGPVTGTIKKYVAVVRTQEWRAMRHGGESERAHAFVDQLYTDVERLDARTPQQEAFYGQAVSALGDVVAARQTRLEASDEALPGVFQVLLVGGGVVVVLFLYTFGARSFRAHAAMVAGVSVVLAFSLFLALELSYPFSGQVAVSSRPLARGHLGERGPP